MLGRRWLRLEIVSKHAILCKHSLIIIPSKTQISSSCGGGILTLDSGIERLYNSPTCWPITMCRYNNSLTKLTKAKILCLLC